MVRTYQVKVATHDKFDEEFKDLPIDSLSPSYEHILHLSRELIPINDRALSASDLESFVYPFARTEIANTIVNPETKNNHFGFELIGNDLNERNYVKDVDNNVVSSAGKSFGTLRSS